MTQIITFLCFTNRAVALGLTAEDMMAVQEFQETLKTKRQPESVATIIKREVAKEDSQMRVNFSGLVLFFWHGCFWKKRIRNCHGPL